MNALKSILTSLFARSMVHDYDDPVLGVMRWRPCSESWVSQPLAPAGRFYLQIFRYKRAPAPTPDCIHVARKIAGDVAGLEREVRILLACEAERRPLALRECIVALTPERVTLHQDSGKVSGEVILQGPPPLDNWSVWHADGVPNAVAQHWE